MVNIFQEFQWRDVVKGYTKEAEKHLAENKVTAYIGFDPTAPSLHVGSLLPIMCLARLQKYGHTPIVIVGGGTGMIGDPSGRATERQLLTLEKIEENLKGIKKQLSQFLNFNSHYNSAKIINNADWLVPLSVMDYLRDIGKHYTTNYMRAKESVKKREEDGISYTEFSYMLLQAYDFLILNQKYGCTMQMGGSDQWGNIVAGIDLIGKKTGKQAYGLTFPLVTSSTGSKFGKTESGTIWLDSNLTSPYKFYQFWLNTTDDDVIKYLKYFSWLDRDKIKQLEIETKNNPNQRNAQQVLADEITKTVHGNDLLQKAKFASQILFGESMKGISSIEIKEIFNDVPSFNYSFNKIENDETNIVDFLVSVQIFPSKGEARRIVNSGGVYINNEKVFQSDLIISKEYTIEGKFIVVRKGKKNYYLINLIK